LRPEQQQNIVVCSLRSLNEIDNRLLVNPGVHLQLARKFDMSVESQFIVSGSTHSKKWG